jgi:hypothetical protein
MILKLEFRLRLSLQSVQRIVCNMEEKSKTISLVRPNREYFINWWFNFSVSETNNNPLIEITNKS